MKFELRLFFAAFLLLLAIVVSCRCESIARAPGVAGQALHGAAAIGTM